MISNVQEIQDVHVHLLDPVVQEFQDFIEGDAAVLMYFNQMFDQAPPPKSEEQRKVCPNLYNSSLNHTAHCRVGHRLPRPDAGHQHYPPYSPKVWG